MPITLLDFNCLAIRLGMIEHGIRCSLIIRRSICPTTPLSFSFRWLIAGQSKIVSRQRTRNDWSIDVKYALRLVGENKCHSFAPLHSWPCYIITRPTVSPVLVVRYRECILLGDLKIYLPVTSHVGAVYCYGYWFSDELLHKFENRKLGNNKLTFSWNVTFYSRGTLLKYHVPGLMKFQRFIE